MHPTLLSTLAALCVLPPILASPYPFHSFRGQSLTRSYGRGPQPSRVHLSSYPTATSTPVSYCPPQPAPERYQREIFDAFVQQLYVEKDVFGAFDKFIAVDLIERMPAPFLLSTLKLTDYPQTTHSTPKAAPPRPRNSPTSSPSSPPQC